ncbi:MAG: DMT family transporter [Deltaproteobacteria bacterium]|nr:MAG: DMT family transporter [Deltaproteobacteria bacterium]
MTKRDTETNQRLSPAYGLLQILICFLWGANLVSIRISNQGIPPLLAAASRSVIAASLLWLYARLHGLTVFFEKRDRIHGIIIGCLFGIEFLFIYWGLAFTTASRSVIFLYTHPFWVALGAHFFLKGDRLTVPKVVGLVLAFTGILSVFGSGSIDLPPAYWIGDLMELAAAIFWAATTLYVKKLSQDRDISHYQTLFAQLLYSIPVLAFGWAVFENLQGPQLSMLVVSAFAYQCLVVAFFSYILWFWMISRFAVSNLTAFTFFAPLFGTILGAVILSEPVTLMVWFGLGLVGTGIYLVNR